MAKTKTVKQKTQASNVVTGDMEVSVCRRRDERRQGGAKRAKAAATAVVAEPDGPNTIAGPKKQPAERRKVQRRRQIDPTTCERDYTNEEIEFMHALDAYKRSSGRMFPTCSEILEVVRGLGYCKLDGADAEAPVSESPAATDQTGLVGDDVGSQPLPLTDLGDTVAGTLSPSPATDA